MYYFGNPSGRILTGWQQLSEGKFYLYDDGTVKQGWQEIGKEKYYVKNNFVLMGFHEIDGKKYLFGNPSGRLLKGWQIVNGNSYYLKTDGTLFEASGWQEIEGKKYYFDGDHVVKGVKRIDGQEYYFNDITGELKTGMEIINGIEYYFDNNGFLKKVQYIPVYYSQQDSRWAAMLYGKGNMKNSGCAPTSMAMAFNGILSQTVLPTYVASYLFYNTSEFNKVTQGASGLAVQYAANNFGVKWSGISSLDELNKALDSGKIVFANIGPGKFTKPFLTHAIVLYRYENGQTIALDPYNSSNNGWISTNTVWNEQSRDSYDLRGGYAFYALG